MAASASARLHSAQAQQLTSQSTSGGAATSWTFAVPLHNPDPSYEQEPYPSDHATSPHTRQPFTELSNGYARPVRSNTLDSQGQAFEREQPHPVAERPLRKRPSGNMSGNSIDQEGVMEYYKSHANNKRGPTAVKGKPRKKPAGKAGSQDPNVSALEHDENNWIHRDKLKEIEIREMEEAGFRVGRSSRSASRSQSATRRSRSRGQSRSRAASVSAEGNQNGDERFEARKVVSPIPAEDEEDLERHQVWGSPNHEEYVSESHQTSPRAPNHTIRPSTSRIPLPKTFGLPLTGSGADGTQSRSRAGSENWNSDATAGHVRHRSGSIGSQVLLDGHDDERQVTPPYGHARKVSSSNGSPPKSPRKSPMKAKTPGKSGPTSGARKTSVKTQPKNRQASGTTPPKRPGTSSGSASRPSTSHRPEGEAPWLATMYKPDPRLPPDQQIIPTHAKRMQQEQWENEGRVGSMYDKEFRILPGDELSDKRLSLQLNPIDLQKPRENEEWPLPSPSKISTENEKRDSNTSKSPTSDQGGYKLTPTIPQGPRVASPNLAPPIAPAEAPALAPQPLRLPEPVEETKEKKGCCCIVM